MAVEELNEPIIARITYFASSTPLLQSLLCIRNHAEIFRAHLILEHTYLLTQIGFAGTTTLKEKWYGTDYNMFPLDKVSQIDRWTQCLQGTSEWAESVFLPLKNPFVPTDFDIRTSTTATSASPASLDAAVAVAASEAKAVPDLIQCMTTLSIEIEEEVVEIVADTVVSAEAKEDETADEPVAEEAKDDEEEEEEEQEPAGQLPPLEGKVTQRCHHLYCLGPTVCQMCST